MSSPALPLVLPGQLSPPVPVGRRCRCGHYERAHELRTIARRAYVLGEGSDG